MLPRWRTARHSVLVNDPAFPTCPVPLVVGYTAGGATDVLPRLVAQKTGDALDQSMVVENRAGANSNVGAEVVATASPDGYTIANTINATLYDKLNYDPAKDFELVGIIARIPNWWLIRICGPPWHSTPKS